MYQSTRKPRKQPNQTLTLQNLNLNYLAHSPQEARLQRLWCLRHAPRPNVSDALPPPPPPPAAARKEPSNTQKPSAMPRRSFNYSTYPRPTNSRRMHARRWYIYSCYPSGAHTFFSTTPPPDSTLDSAPTVRPRAFRVDTSDTHFSAMSRDYGYSNDDCWDPAGIKPLILCMCKAFQVMET